MIWSWFPAPAASWEALLGFMAQQHVPPWWNERLEPGGGWVGVEEPWKTRLTCWYIFLVPFIIIYLGHFLYSLGNFLPPFFKGYGLMMEILDCDEWMFGQATRFCTKHLTFIEHPMTWATVLLGQVLDNKFGWFLVHLMPGHFLFLYYIYIYSTQWVWPNRPRCMSNQHMVLWTQIHSIAPGLAGDQKTVWFPTRRRASSLKVGVQTANLLDMLTMDPAILSYWHTLSTIFVKVLNFMRFIYQLYPYHK